MIAGCVRPSRRAVAVTLRVSTTETSERSIRMPRLTRFINGGRYAPLVSHGLRPFRTRSRSFGNKSKRNATNWSNVMNWATMSRAARDAAYNNAAAVPEAAALREARTAASAAARQTWSGALDVPYGLGERNRWDLFPAANPSAPCLVFIHGGYWQMNRREDFVCLGAGVRSHGWSVALPGYSLAPAAPLTTIVAEMNDALNWLAAEGPRHGLNGPIVVSGWSAGAHLAALVLAHPAVTAGLAISGVFELAPLRDTYLDEKLHLTEAEVAEFSPLRLAPVAKRLAIAYGTAELPALVSDSRRLHAQRAAAHVPGALIPLAGANHFTVLDALVREDGELTRAVLDLAR